MQTSHNKHYYDLLRTHDRRQRKQMAEKRGDTLLKAMSGAGNSTNGAASSSNNNNTVMGTSSSFGNAASAGSAPSVPSAAAAASSGEFRDPGEGRTVILDPIKELSIPPTAIKSRTELSLPRRAATALHPNFLLFDNLEILILQHNQLSEVRNLLPPALPASANTTNGSGGGTVGLSGPRGCARLRQLFLSHNRISDLSAHTDIPRLRCLERLYLAGNRLSDLTGVLAALRRLRSLAHLDLRGNPASEEVGYRARVLRALPQLEVLDRQVVTDAERREAEAAAKEDLVARSARAALDSSIFAPAAGGGGTARSRSVGGLNGTATGAGGAAPTTGSLLNKSGTCSDTLGGAAATANGEKTVAFGSTYHPPPPDPAAAAGVSAAARLAEPSACAKLLGTRYRRHVAAEAARAQGRQRTEEEAVAEALERRTAFHAVWALSQPGMPLSAAARAEWAAQETTSPEAAAAAAAEEAALLAQQQQQAAKGRRRRSSSTGSRRGSSVSAAAAATAAAAAAAAAAASAPPPPPSLLLSKERLLPALPPPPPPAYGTSAAAAARALPTADAASAQGQRAPLNTAIMHESVLFDKRRCEEAARSSRGGKARGLAAAPSSAPAPPAGNKDWAAEHVPAEGRLEEMQAAMRAASELLRPLHVLDGSAEASATHPAPAGGQPKPQQQRRTLMGSAGSGAAPPMTAKARAAAAAAQAERDRQPHALDRSLLAQVQAHKVAMVPPPWEGLPATEAVALPDAELQRALVGLVRLLFLPSECDSLAAQFGAADILTVLDSDALPGSAGSGSGSNNNNAASATGAAAAAGGGGRPLSSSGRGGAAAGGGGKRKGRNQVVSVTSAAASLLQDNALYKQMTSALVVTASEGGGGGGPRGSRVGSSAGLPDGAGNNNNNSVFSAAVSAFSAAASAANAASTAGGALSTTTMATSTAATAAAVGAGAAASTPGAAAAAKPGVVGPYTLPTVDSFVGALGKNTGAWDALQPCDLLAALVAAHNIAALSEEYSGIGGSGNNTGGPGEGRAGSMARTAGGGGNASVHSNNNNKSKRASSSAGGKRRSNASMAASSSTTSRDGGDDGGAHTTSNSAGNRWRSTAARTVARKALYLTVNNLMGALVRYLPFVESRVAYFRKMSVEAIGLSNKTASDAARREEAKHWYSLFERANQYAEQLRADLAAHTAATAAAAAAAKDPADTHAGLQSPETAATGDVASAPAPAPAAGALVLSPRDVIVPPGMLATRRLRPMGSGV